MGHDSDRGGSLATLYVGDLHPDVTEMHLHEKFQGYGPLAMIHVCRDSVTRRSLGYAYVNYYSHVDAQQAMDKLNYTDIKGRCCRIMWNNRERQVRASTDANVFIRNLDPSIDSRSLYDTFSIFGHILSCKVSTDAVGTSRGYGFVQYESEDAAKQAIERVDGMLIGGRRVFVGRFIARERRERTNESTDCSLYVRNIPGDWDDVQVQDLFAPFGDITSCLIMNDGRSDRRYGFINYKDPEAAAKALEALHGKDMRTEEEKMAAPEDAPESKKDEGEEAHTEKEEGEEAPEGEEEKKTEEEATADGAKASPAGAKADRLPSYCLFVSHSKSKAEREVEAKKRAEARQEKFEGIKLFVRNLTADMTDSALKALFDRFGTVTDVKAVLDRETGACKGYGFVRFSTMEEATAAVSEMHLKEAIPGQAPLHVGLAGQAAGKGGEQRREKGGGAGGKGGCGGKAFGKGGGKDPRWNPAAAMQQGLPPMYYAASLPGPALPGSPGMPQRAPWQALPPWGVVGGPLPMARPGMLPAGYGQRPGMPPVGYLPPPGQPRPPVQQSMPAGGLAPAPALAALGGPLTAAALASAPPAIRKQMLGEKLFPVVARYEPQLAGKITGMLLEMDDTELLILLESEATMREKVAEAVRVLSRSAAKGQEQPP